MIYSNIKKNKKIFLLIKKTFLKILADVLLDQDEINQILRESNYGYEVLLPIDSFEDCQRKLQAWHELSQLYFKHLIDKEIENGDTQSASILYSVKEEFLRGTYSISRIYASEDPYSKRAFLLKYNLMAKSYAILTIQNYILYINFSRILPPFHKYLNELSDIFAKDFINKIINITFEILEVEKSEENILHHTKLIKDLLAIASEIYFTSLSLEVQITLLNQKCDLGDLIKEFLNSNPRIEIFEWNLISFALTSSGYYDLALEMCLVYLRKNKNIDDSYKFLLFDSIASIYKLKENFSKALQYYLIANKMVETSLNWPVQTNPFDIFDLTSKSESEKLPLDYKKAISLKNIGECYGHLNQRKKMFLHFNQVQIIAKNLTGSKYEKFIHWNLVSAYRRLGMFNNERDELNLLIDNLDLFNEEIGSIIEHRIDEFLVTNMDYNKLNELELLKKFTDGLNHGKKAQLSLSFKQSIKILKKAVLISKQLSNSEKLIAFKELGYSLLYFGKWNSASKIFNQILALSNDLESVGIIAFLNYKIENNDDGLLYTQKFLSEIVKNLDKFQDLLDCWILIMLNLLNEQKFKEILQSLYIVQIPNKDILFIEFSNKIANHGFSDLGIYLIKQALSLVSDDRSKSICLSNLGIIYYNLGQPMKAIEEYKKAIKLDEKNCFYYQNLAAAYSYMLDYTSALDCIKNALKICRENLYNNLIPEFELRKFKLETLSKNVLNINKVSEKVKAALISAENIFRDYHDKNDLPDASAIAMLYSKGLEIMLDEKISIYLKPFILKKYGNSYIQNQDIWKKFGNLLNNKTINIGSWKRIIEDINKSKINPELIPFKDIIKSRFNDENLTIIKEGIELILKPRNPGSHSEIISMDEIINLRGDIISKLNQIINLFY